MLGYALSEGALSEGDAAAPGGATSVEGSGAVTLLITASGDAVHGVAGVGAAALAISAAATGTVGVTGTGAASLSITAAGAAQHLRYELRGEVRQGGVLVNRRVRAHLRSTGQVVAEVDTVAGRFVIATGFAQAEHYIVPIDMDAAAVDWSPPVANRVLSALAQDA